MDLCEAIRDHGGTPGYSLPAARIVAKEQGLDINSASQDKRLEIINAAAERYLVAFFFSGLNRGRYNKLKKAVHNGHILNRNPMPETYERLLWQS